MVSFLRLRKITGITTVCRDFRVQAVTVGKDAQAEVSVELEATAERYRGQLHRGRGVSTDSLEASAKAFLAAVNRVAIGGKPRLHPQLTLSMLLFLGACFQMASSPRSPVRILTHSSIGRMKILPSPISPATPDRPPF